MTFTMRAAARSLANYLAPALPNVHFYANPNQQDTQLPALFLRKTNAKIMKKTGDRFLRRLGLDLVYLEETNIADTESRLQAAADVMDLRMETFPYSDGKEKPVLLRTYDRHWEIADDGTLHYKFNLQLWLTRTEDDALMQWIQELNLEAT